MPLPTFHKFLAAQMKNQLPRPPQKIKESNGKQSAQSTSKNRFRLNSDTAARALLTSLLPDLKISKTSKL